MKLPKRKYVPERNWETTSYALGWNSIIENTKEIHKVFGEEQTKEDLLKEKTYDLYIINTEVGISMTKNYYRGRYDCIVEIEKLNKITKGKQYD